MSTFRRIIFSQKLKSVSGGGGGGSPIITSGLLVYWKFDEGTGTNASDASGNGLNGTLLGSTLPSWVAGYIGPGALSFNGSTAYVASATTSALNPTSNDISVVVWVKLAGANGSTQVIVSNYNSSSGVYYYITKNSSGNFTANVQGLHGSPSRVIDNSKNYNDGNWHHVVLVFNFTTQTATLYVDGSNKGTGSATVGPTGPSSALVVGQLGTAGGLFLNGSVDEVAVYNRSLSSSEITTLFNQTHP